jgi:hypothetical protein
MAEARQPTPRQVRQKLTESDMWPAYKQLREHPQVCGFLDFLALAGHLTVKRYVTQ